MPKSPQKSKNRRIISDLCRITQIAALKVKDEVIMIH